MEQAYNFDLELAANKHWLFIGGGLLLVVGTLLFLTFYVKPEFLNYYLLANFVIAALVIFIQAQLFWFRKAIGFWLHILSGSTYLLTATLFILNFKLFIYQYLFLLLLLFVVAYFCSGLFRIAIALTQHCKSGWLWTFYCGLINLFAVIFIIFGMGWAPMATLIIATSSDIAAMGVALIALGFAANN